MKKVIFINSFIDLEREYMRQHNPYLIEEKLLLSFNREELQRLIEVTKEEYLKEKLPYSNNLQRAKLKLNYLELDEISKYFIDMINYYFAGGEEIELTKKFLNRLDRFYKINYEPTNNYKKGIDIKTIPIREILSMYINLPKNLRKNIRCPLKDHQDKTASFKVYEKNNSFYCYGCHRGGNILNLISEIENISTKEAYKKLLKIYG